MRLKQKGADAAVLALFSHLDESNGNLRGMYEGRLRSRVRDVEGIKRKWEELTGQPVPKRLRTDDFYSKDEKAAVEPAVKPPAVKPPTDAVKPLAKPASTTHESIVESVNKMAYNDIRRELKERSLGCVGKKPELVDRLVNARMKDVTREEVTRKKEMLGMSPKKGEESAKRDDVGGTKEAVAAKEKAVAVNEKEVVAATKDPVTEVEDVDMDDAENTAPKTDEVTTVEQKPAAKATPKSALKPSKFALAKARAASPVRAASPAKFNLSAKADLSKKPAPVKEPDVAKDTTKLPPKDNCKISSGSDSSNSKSSKASATSKASIAKFTPIQTTPSFKTGTGTTSATKLSERKKELSMNKAIRTAKIAEMRERARNEKAAVNSATKPYTSASNLTSAASKFAKSTTNFTTGDKVNPLVAKMREKAAAEKAGAPSSALASKLVPLSAAITTSVKSSPDKPYTSSLKAKALKQMMDPANKIPMKKEEKPLSPMQTYEMSDRDEESSSDEDSDDDASVDKPKKAIPDWAQKTNLHRALNLQFADGPRRLDPDRIFGEVETCNLEQIFGDVKSKKRYHKRTSSGNWTKDKVTIVEKLAYKRTMGYNQS